MDQETKAKWVAALRSGEYQQCSRTLHDGKGYCCLGVLCKVTGYRSSNPDTIGLVGEEHFDIPEETRIKLEMMNDDGMEFQKIADFIEANL